MYNFNKKLYSNPCVFQHKHARVFYFQLFKNCSIVCLERKLFLFFDKEIAKAISRQKWNEIKNFNIDLVNREIESKKLFWRKGI
jgi:hypothetical protein